MFQAGNQELVICLVLAGDLTTAHVFYPSLGVLAELGVLWLQGRKKVH